MAQGRSPGVKFGTDGVRGVANTELTPEDALRLGYAAARVFGGQLLVGRDTRISGSMLAGALAAGVASGGGDVLDAGILPTPGVAALAPRLEASAGAVVSASHNPFPDNGIKFFSARGRKLPSETEREIERFVAEAGEPAPEVRPTSEGVGEVRRLDDASDRYVAGALKLLRPRAEGLKVRLDCANGAAYRAAPMLFSELGAEVSVAGAEPTGTNINDRCGSTNIGELDGRGADVSFAFDGDADRVLALDERGEVVDGDRIIALLARDMFERGVLAPAGAVVTVMSNLGFFKALDSLEIPYEVTPVGDRHVAETMYRDGASLGGEQSGHVILSDYVTTGDGLMTALAILDVMTRTGKPLSELAGVMDVYPQELINVRVAGTDLAQSLSESERVSGAVRDAESRLGSEGRILLRPSGTEPLVRVMVEHADPDTCREVCEAVAGVVEAAGSGGSGSRKTQEAKEAKQAKEVKEEEA
ncbi:phosphoglucosamine mutase [Rubrobacter aplysinae]|uniref:phosphoglucosamine mutase n=1 Tax=Rubrobacter aplysinae TaxID=909625 RepID=UPI000A64123E|nr:phosphoglucosamine mutase [Rubrobacter aplysinae]